VEDCEAPLVVVLCSAGFVGVEAPDSDEEEGLGVEGEEEPEPEPEIEDDPDEEAALVTLPLSVPLAEVEALPVAIAVDDAPAFRSDQQRQALASWPDGIVTGNRHRRGGGP
jgi:hypothetical protein